MQNINLPDAKAMKASERNWRVTGAAADKRCMEAHLLIQDNAEEPDPLSRVKMAWCSNLIAGFMHIYLDTTAQTYWMSLGCHRKAALLLGPLQTTVVHCRDGQLLTFICFKKPRDIATRWKILYDCFDPARGAARARDDFQGMHSVPFRPRHLEMRKYLGLYANIRPVKVYDSLMSSSPLKASILKNTDFKNLIFKT